MDPATLAAGALGAASFAGGLFQNDANRSLSHQQMDWQERMSNTSWQRTVADMRAAGINPMLAVSKGGASVPGSSSIPMQNPTAGVSSAARLADLANLRKQGDLLDAQRHKADTESMNTATNTLISELQIPQINLLSEFYRDHPNLGTAMLLSREIAPGVGSVGNLIGSVGNLRKLLSPSGSATGSGTIINNNPLKYRDVITNRVPHDIIKEQVRKAGY